MSTFRSSGTLKTMMSETDFDSRFEELATIAHRVAFRITGSREEAREITQESLTRAFIRWRKISTYPEPWIAQVASNLAIDHIRRRSRSARVDLSPVQSNDPLLFERLDLVRALRELPRRQRQVIVLRFLADLPEAAVARELRLSIGSVKQHASRGLAALRLSLATALPDHVAPTLAEEP